MLTSLPIIYHYIIKGLFTSVTLSSESCPYFNKKIQGIFEDKKYSLKKISTRTRVTYGNNVGIIRLGIFKNHYD